MAGLFDRQADIYVEARPTYPKEWYSKLAENYQQVVATDISEAQLKYAIQHPRVQYIHTPTSLSEDKMVNLIAGGHDNSAELIIVAEAIHWFDLPQFYSLQTPSEKTRRHHCCLGLQQNAGEPEFDPLFDRFREISIPFTHPNAKFVRERYKTLPFLFESVGMGREGEPLTLELPKEASFDGVERMLRSYSAVIRAEDQGVDMLPEEVIKEFERAWGGRDLVRTFKERIKLL